MKIAVNNVKSARQEMETARTNAESAKARELSPARFQAGENAEAAALRLQNAKQWDPAAIVKFNDAAKSYSDAGSDARAAAAKRDADAAAAAKRDADAAAAAKRDADAAAAAKRDADAAAAAKRDADAAAAAKRDADAAAAAKRDADAAAAAKRDADAAAAAKRDADAAAAQRAAVLKANSDAVESEKAAIRKVLDRYKSAYQAKNVVDVKAVYKSLPPNEEKNLREPSIASFQIDLAQGDIQVLANTAIATYQRTMVAKAVKGGKDSPPVSQQVAFNLRKDGGSWTISSIDIKK